MAGNPNRRILLTVAQQNVYTANVLATYRVTITASNGNLMDPKLFLFRQKPPVVGSSTVINEFITVCTPVQLQSVNADMPDPADPNMLYRTNVIDTYYPTPDLANSAVTDIVAAVGQLKTALDYAENQTSTIFWIGTPPPS